MKLENPYRHGAYHFTVAALIQMGINKAHKFSIFAAKFQKVWSKEDAEGWKGFKNRQARNEATAKDLDGRILQNCRVLQRVKDYGRPLLKAGAVLDLTRDDAGVLQVCLNTKSKKAARNPVERPKQSMPQSKPVRKSQPKSTRKPSGGKKRAGKRSVKATAAVLGEPRPSESVITGSEPTKSE